jgi:hypothetical protein
MKLLDKCYGLFCATAWVNEHMYMDLGSVYLIVTPNQSTTSRQSGKWDLRR